MAEAVILLAVTKIGVALGNEAARQAGAHFATCVTKLTELQGGMSRITCVLGMLHDFLRQADIRNRNNQVYKRWMDMVRIVVYEIEDMVDEYLYIVGQEHYSSNVGWSFYLKKSMKKPRTLLSLSRIACRAKKAEEDLTHLSQMKEQWVDKTITTYSSKDAAIPSSSSCKMKASNPRSPKKEEEEEDLVGVDVESNKRKLQEWIGDDEPARTVIVVQGMGGIGKTTLAAAVYREEMEKFDCHAWVPISQNYDREDAMKRLVAELFKEDQNSVFCDTGTMDMATTKEERLSVFLQEKKYLIVLDDVWDHEAYSDFFETLPDDRKGSRVVITTRSAPVARLASGNRRLKPEELSDDDSFKLLCKKAFPDHDKCPDELEDLSKKILGKCKGLPLAIVSIGSLLRVRDKTREEWKRIHDQLTWELANNPKLEDVRNVLHLSFIYLPPWLKNCFLYCSLFPEDYIFHRKKLVRWWMAERFIEERGESTMEEVAEGYLNDLVERSMLQLVRRNSSGRMKSFQMHDIVRELAVDLCQREYFGVPYQKGERGHKSLEKLDGRRRVVVSWKKDIEQSSWSACHCRLRSIIALHMPSPTLLLPLVVEKARCMSVLELTGLPMEKVPDAIGDLFNLRHLGLRDSKVKLLPKSIEKLSNLLTLDLSGACIHELPRGITKLKKLRHLFAEKSLEGQGFRWGRGVCLPKDVGNLTDLQTLQAVEVEDDEESVRQMGELTQMRSIRIWNVKGIYWETLYRALNQMRYLSYLHMAASDENELLQLNGLALLPPSLEKLYLNGRLMDEALDQESPLLEVAASQNLYTLCLAWSQLRQDPLPRLCRLPNLSELRLKRAYIGEQLVFLGGWFPKLKELCLLDMPDLKRLEFHQGAMPRLEQLYLSDLAGMTELPIGMEFVMPLRSLHFHGAMTPELSASVKDFIQSLPSKK